MELGRIVHRLRRLAAQPALPADTARQLLELASQLEADPLVGTVEAARVLGVRSPNTVKNWIRRGQLHAAQRGQNGRWRVTLSELLRLRQQMDGTGKDRS